MSTDLHCPLEAEIIGKERESRTIVTLTLRLTDADAASAFRFLPGQFNMLYVKGVGEIPISIASDPDTPEALSHTIRATGRVSTRLTELEPGDRIGLRGPFGRGWPLEQLGGRDLIIVTGGLGCAPVAPVISYITDRRQDFGRLAILHGVKHCSDLIWGECYSEWAAQDDTQVLLSADRCDLSWSGTTGPVTQLFDQLEIPPSEAAAMICGPEPMQHACAEWLLANDMPAGDIWLSLERNMRCAVGLCGHCQFGEHFICRDGPVFRYDVIRPLIGRPYI
jgi:NAD(P)H-flavin reductase